MTQDQAISEVLTTALDAAKKTGAWLQGQVPDVIHQLIAWNVAKDVFLLSFGLIFIAVYAVSTRRIIANDDGSFAPTLANIWVFIGAPISICWAISLIINGLDLIELIVAPKVWLLEYAAQLVK